MSPIRSFKLELLRAGPEHNQLLSPLTPYIALGGASPPRTVTLPFEHRHLLSRLARLRYAVDGQEIAKSQRDDELRNLGEDVGKVLGAVHALQTALDASARAGAPLLHLRLAMSALELGMIPFEAAIAPDNLPGSGASILLRTPTILTREVRRNAPIEVRWNRKPRILFAFAAPGGLARVPAQGHLNALRRAIDPFLKRIADEVPPPGSDAKAHADAAQRTETRRLEQVEKILTVLPDASLAQIQAACRDGEYTHVHILAHGAPIDQGTRPRFGVALTGEGGAGSIDIVDGERLAIALQGLDASGRGKQLPTVVSLATCDSGAVDSVLAPGGSIAHELHAAGIPWVVASQFPLWMKSSVIAAEVLYARLLEGYDPRWVLYELRQRLRTAVPQTHDWASIVAYATAPWDFDDQVAAFRERQFKERLEVRFGRIDALLNASRPTPEAAAELDGLVHAIRREHEQWTGELGERAKPAQRAERLGMSAASEKRIAIIYGSAGDQAASSTAYGNAIGFYEKALAAEPTNHWVVTQMLSLRAIPPMAADDGALASLRTDYGASWLAVQQIARWQLAGSTGVQRAWAQGTLAELELLGTVFGNGGESAERIAARIEAACKDLVAAAGADSFAVSSTRRQFDRYRLHWTRAAWTPLVDAALRALKC